MATTLEVGFVGASMTLTAAVLFFYLWTVYEEYRADPDKAKAEYKRAIFALLATIAGSAMVFVLLMSIITGLYVMITNLG